MNNYIVYKHTIPSEKVYIGITSMKPEKRWKTCGGKTFVYAGDDTNESNQDV